MESKLDILFIGTALVDSILRGFDPKPISASGYLAASGSLNVGGEAVNGSMAAAKLGMRTGILCSLGEDDAGELVLSALRRSGVDTRFVIRDEAHPTPVTTMFVHEDGGRKSVCNAAHRYNFHPEQYPDRIRCARAIVLGSLFRAPFDDPAIIRAVLQEAKNAGAMTFADTKLPNYRVLSLADVRDALPLVDCITPNEDEARYFTGRENPEEMADCLLECGVGCAIIKLGGKGCLMKTREKTLRLPAFPIDATDATGAGDNFLAGFVSETLRGCGPEEALRFANACGAICTTAVGAATALKNQEQVRKFLREFSSSQTA